MPTAPRRLSQGDTIGVIAPSSAPPNPSTLDFAVEALNCLGFKAKLSTNLRKRWGFLAGTDRERAEDVMEMFRDPQVQGIVCFRGGYGAARLLPLLDYETIRANPKAFIGYSDITALHCAFLAKADLVSFHGPMLKSDFLKKNPSTFTRQSLLRTITQASAPGSIVDGRKNFRVKVLTPGVASGPLVGGNISILCASLATPYQPNFAGAVLFFEDLNEEPYRFDRMLTQLLNAGLLQQVAGIAIGTNKNCRDRTARRTTEYRQTLEDVFKERLTPLKVPIVTGLPFGHVRDNATLPVGGCVTLDADRGDLIVSEPAVR